MRELIRSLIRFSWDFSEFGLRGLFRIFVPGWRSFYQEQLAIPSSNKKASFVSTVNRFDTSPEKCSQRPVGGERPPEGASAKCGRLNLSRIVVMGEGLGAGMGDFSLTSDTQRTSFPALMAAQMEARFVQALLQPPGIHGLEGLADLPVLIPAPLQSTVLEELPPNPVSNLSVPGFTLLDALEFRPAQPLIHRFDQKQTAVNLTWGILPIAQGFVKDLPTQLQYAVQQSPTLTIVELGYYEAIQAVVHSKPGLVGEVECCMAQYTQIVNALKGTGSEVLMLTVPDPLDTAYCSTLDMASAILKVEPEFLLANYAIEQSDLVTVNGLKEISFQIFGRSIQTLSTGSVIKANTAEEIRSRVKKLNTALVSAAKTQKIGVYDLQALLRHVKQQGISVGSRRLTAAYLGGFYSLNGFYPGATGQAIIANEVLQTLNQNYDAEFPLIELSSVLVSDPVAAYRQAAGPNWSSAELERRFAEYKASPCEPVFVDSSVATSDAQNTWKPIASPNGTRGGPLQLPPNLEQELPLNKESSYFGDGISAINCRTPRDIQWGSSGNFLFGGLAIVDSHLSGNLRIKFSPPVDNITQFEVSFTVGFTGDDSVLVTPQFFKMAFQQNRVDTVPGTVSKGSLNLVTGEVSDLTIYAAYRSTALGALIGVNPTFPKQPLSFPGRYGSAWAKFEQRADGMLDFIFDGSTFVPLGPGIVWPLNFVGPTGDFATIPANGTVMHPHLRLSTKDVAADDSSVNTADIPFNSIQEFTLYTHNSSFGDAFHLNIPAVGGPAKGRSELLGRLQVQFGERTGNTVPFAIWALAPGGIMAELPDSPISEVFPGRLWPGPQGFNESLRFPQRTYPLDVLSILDDPFDICVGALDLRTGRSVNQLLHRAFISQDLIFALLRVEPRTPKDSFFFRGPALLQKGTDGGLVFRFQGIVAIPYPAGFRFPRPDFATGFVVGPGSRLDPFLWFHALQDVNLKEGAKTGVFEHVRASSGDEFSCRYSIPLQPSQEVPVFEYVNHTQGGHFRLHSLAWVGFSDSQSGGDGNGGCDTVTFSGFGVWSNAGARTLQQAAVQISTSTEKPYIGIQIASGDVSNVNTKPMNEGDALP
jgi:hypothetical protein